MLNFNYAITSIKIKSEWFDDLGKKQNVYQKMTYKGLNLYFQLYKFRLHRQENEHIFITSISMLRKETGYTSAEVMDLLKKLKRLKLINLDNISRWDYLLDGDGSIKDKEIIVITANETFSLSDFGNDEDYYIYVPLDLFKLYKEKGLNEKYFALYCLIKKWSLNLEHKSWMKIEKMANILKFDKDYVNKMIYELNRNYLMSSYRRKKSGNRLGFEHYILDSVKPEDIEKFNKSHQENMDKLIKRVDKKKNSKQAINVESELDITEEVEEQEHKAFGTSGSFVDDDPFGNVPINHKIELPNYYDEPIYDDDDELDKLFA